MGEGKEEQLRVGFAARVRLEFVGSKLTSDAGLLVYRELDERLGLTATAGQFLIEQRTGRNVQHELAPLLRQSVYSRLAGYPDTNDADRLARDPALRLVVSRRASGKQAAARNTVGRFETDILAEEANREVVLLQVFIDLGPGKPGIGPELLAHPSLGVPVHDRVQELPPPLGAGSIAIS